MIFAMVPLPGYNSLRALPEIDSLKSNGYHDQKKTLMTRNAGQSSVLEKRLCQQAVFLESLRTPLSSSFCTIVRKICAKWHKKSPETMRFQGFLIGKLSLGELRRASCGFEAVLRSFLSRFSLVFRAFPDFSLFSYPMW